MGASHQLFDNERQTDEVLAKNPQHATLRPGIHNAKGVKDEPVRCVGHLFFGISVELSKSLEENSPSKKTLSRSSKARMMRVHKTQRKGSSRG